MMEELIFKEKSIKYIINEKKNPAHTKEVNECYYILLASICYCITSNEIKLIELSGHKKNDDSEIEISYYSYLLKEINKVLQKLNDDLYIYLNEMYIIDELIQVIELFKKNYNIEKINEIKNNMRENALIIQKNSSDSNIDSIKLSEELIDNFIAFYNLIMNNGDIIKKDKYFYEKVRYILFKEIKKIPDIMYRYNILEKVLEENEIIKKVKSIDEKVIKQLYTPFLEKTVYLRKLNPNILGIKQMTSNSSKHNFEIKKMINDVDKISYQMKVYNNPFLDPNKLSDNTYNSIVRLMLNDSNNKNKNKTNIKNLKNKGNMKKK